MAGMRDKVHIFQVEKFHITPKPLPEIAGDGLRRFENERERYSF